MSARRPQQLVILASGTFILLFAGWAAWTRYRAALDSGPLPRGEALEALRKKFSRDLRFCAAVPAATRAECLENRAVELKEAFFCGELPVGKERDACLAAFVPAVGVFPPCDAISAPASRAACLASAATILGDVHACKALNRARGELASSCTTGDCTATLASVDALVKACPVTLGGDPSSCPKDSAVCHTAMAARRRDPSLCRGGPEEVARCRREVAQIVRDAALCGDDEAGRACRSVVARRKSSLVCDDAELECKGRKAAAGGGAAAACEGDARCLLFLAYRLRKGDGCATIADPPTQKACVELAQ